MNNTSFDYVAIDTNVFEQLFNPCANSSNHIDELLQRLMLCHNTSLIMDCGKRIEAEYGCHLGKRIAQTNHTVPNRRQILNYFFKHNKHNNLYVRVLYKDRMMKDIKSIVKQGTDAIFVYVAFKKEKILITNDRKDIVDEGNRAGLRRRKLLRISKKAGLKNANILTSREAVKVC